MTPVVTRFAAWTLEAFEARANVHGVAIAAQVGRDHRAGDHHEDRDQVPPTTLAIGLGLLVGLRRGVDPLGQDPHLGRRRVRGRLGLADPVMQLLERALLRLVVEGVDDRRDLRGKRQRRVFWIAIATRHQSLPADTPAP